MVLDHSFTQLLLWVDLLDSTEAEHDQASLINYRLSVSLEPFAIHKLGFWVLPKVIELQSFLFY